MSESFDGVMEEMREKVASPYWINMADRLQRAHESEIVELQRQYEQNVIELQRAHRREMEVVRDPQRIGGTLERDSFEYALEQLREFRWQHATNDNDAIPYINGIAKAHEHEMERLRKKCFREGYEAGQRRLVEILEGKDDNDDNDHANAHGCDYGHHRCDQHQVSHDELGNERHKAVCELRGISIDALCRKYDYIDIYPEFIWAVGRAIGLRHDASFEEIINRLIHLLGEDEPDLQKSQVLEDSDAEGAVEIAITDELENERHKAVRKLRDARDSMSDSFVDNVSRIVCAIDARPEVGERVCKAIADRLIHLLDGVHKPDAALPTYDVLGNERHKAIAELQKVCTKLDESVWTWIEDVAIAIGAQDKQSDKYESMLPKITDRLIHLLGGDQPTLSDLYGILQDGEESENKDSESAHKITKSAEIAKPESEDGGKVTITDELRKFKGLINTGLTPEMAIALRVEINRIADRIDEQFDRICQQQEAVLQSTIDTTIDADKIAHKCYIQRVEKLERQRDHWHQQSTDMMNRADAMEHERDNLQQTIDKMTVELESARAKNRRLTWHIDQMQGGSRKWREKCEAMMAQRDELQAKLEEMLKTHVELPKDENDEYIHVEDVMDGYGKTIEVVELRYGRSGWMLISRDGNGYADTFAFAHHHEPTVEQVIRDLKLGKITEAQAIERIEVIHG